MKSAYYHYDYDDRDEGSADDARADAIIERDGETNELSSYYRMRADWKRQLAENARRWEEDGTE